MSTIQMTGPATSGTFPLPSGAVTISNGIASVPPQDVPAAIMQGFRVMAGQNWPGAALRHMTVPSKGSWPTSGSLTLPDNSTITVTSGAVLMPIAWIAWARSNGFTDTPGAWGQGVMSKATTALVSAECALIEARIMQLTTEGQDVLEAALRAAEAAYGKDPGRANFMAKMRDVVQKGREVLADQLPTLQRQLTEAKERLARLSRSR